MKKKSRKAVQKLGLKPVTGINRVTLRKGKNYLFVINQPEVYKSGGGVETYVIFGEAKVEDTTSQLRDAAEKFKGADLNNIDPSLFQNLAGKLGDKKEESTSTSTSTTTGTTTNANNNTTSSTTTEPTKEHHVTEKKVYEPSEDDIKLVTDQVKDTTREKSN